MNMFFSIRSLELRDKGFSGTKFLNLFNHGPINGINFKLRVWAHYRVVELAGIRPVQDGSTS